jgi:FrmR/RcnR family transcriptional regulator, repressor of frmRAB operon
MHIVADRDKLLARVRRIAGQVAAVERQLTGDAGCSETLQLVASVRGAVGSLMAPAPACQTRRAPQPPKKCWR